MTLLSPNQRPHFHGTSTMYYVCLWVFYLILETVMSSFSSQVNGNAGWFWREKLTSTVIPVLTAPDSAFRFWYQIRLRLSVMNLVTTHYNCTSPMDYISHHALHTHIPVHHYTNHTAVTIHSSTLIASPHLHLIHSLT